MNHFNTIADAISEAINQHRQWARDTNEFLVCRLHDINQWFKMDKEARIIFFKVVQQLQATNTLSDEMVQLQVIKIKTHQLAKTLILNMQDTGIVSQNLYREFSDLHAQFLTDALEIKKCLWMEYANTDELTGLMNRKVMKNLLDSESDKVKVTGASCVVAMADIDHFKYINDTYGHAMGDIVLKTVANLIKDNLRKTDMLFRYGGEEFLICMPGISLEVGVTLINSIRERIAVHQIELPIEPVIDDPIEYCEVINNQLIQLKQPTQSYKPIINTIINTITITISFGLTQLKSNTTVKQSIIAADTALYQAKKQGRNRVEYA